MASKVLKSFLIGIGYDTKALEAGDKKIQASLQGIKSSALGISAALVGAFGAGAGVILSTASKIDKLAAATQNMRTAMATSYNFGNAVKLMGGDAQEGIDAFKKFEDIQNNLGVKGDPGPVNDLAVAGLNVDSLYKTKTAEEFMSALADMIPRLNEAQRSVVQQTLGISDYAFRLLKDGSEKAYAEMAKAANATGSIDQMTENARKLSESTALLGLKFEGVTNELTEKFLPSLIGASEWMGKFLSEHRGEISKGIDVLAENPQATAGIGVGAATAVAGAGLSKVGLSGIGGTLKSAGQIGMAISLADLMTPYVDPMFDKLFGIDRATPDVYSGQIERSPEDIEYLNHRDRSALDSMPPSSGPTLQEDRQANAEALAGALNRTPIKVESKLNATIQLDGRALEYKIIQVNERLNYEAAEDFKPTTER